MSKSVPVAVSALVRTLLPVAGLIVGLAAAAAADLPPRSPPPPLPVPPTFTWTGFSTGGGATGGFAGGGQAGSNEQVTPGSGFVLGVEADIQGTASAKADAAYLGTLAYRGVPPRASTISAPCAAASATPSTGC